MKSFDEIFIDKTKYGVKVQTSEYSELGEHIIIDQGQSQIAGYTDREEGLFEEVPVIVFGDHTRIIKYVDKPFFLGADGVKVLRSKDENANYKYLYYALKNAKIPNTGYNRHFKWLKNIQINYPAVEKQAEIVAILDKVSSVIGKREDELSALDDLIKARFVEMFGNPVLNDKRWEQKSLGDITTKIGSGATPKGGKETYQEKGITLIRSMNVHNGKFEYKDLAHISDEQGAKLDNVMIEENDVLLNITGASVIVLFLLCILTVLRFVPHVVTFFAVFIGVFLCDRKIFCRINYGLLIKFIILFIVVGDVAQIPWINKMLSTMIVGNEVAGGILISQIVSNVPAAILIARFTSNGNALLLGVNIGGLGTLIASMASMISLDYYEKSIFADKKAYILSFTKYNILFLLIEIVLVLLL